MNLDGIGMTSKRTRERLINRLVSSGISDLRVLDAFRETPRHIFVDEALSHRAYEDKSLPIGFGQTISQPYIVARMTELLLREGTPNKVLEIGTGSGFQTTILAQLVPWVYSVERIQPLQDKARDRFRLLGLKNIHLKHSDGGFGWTDQAPFDAIIATCAPEEVPDELKQQLSPDGGKLVIPVGDKDQTLVMITRQDQSYTRETFDQVLFVPLVRDS